MAKNKMSIDYKKTKDFLSKNFWTFSTLVLAILLIVILFLSSNSTVSSNIAGQNVLAFAEQQGVNAELVSVNDDGSLYEVVLSIDGQEVPVYVTKDGKTLVAGQRPLETTQSTPTPNTPTPSTPTPTPTVVKSEKPIVEAFVMSHCPYGTQIEKGLIPVMKLLGDKADIEIKFVYYAMHPSAGEVQEQLNQYCIQEEQNELYLDYLTCFLEAGNGKECIKSTKIDTVKLATCVKATDAKFDIIKNLEDQSLWLSGKYPLFNINKAENDAYKIGGSPALVINGAEVDVGRDSQSLLNAICAAFNKAPEECNTDLSSLGNPAPGFGFNTQGGATAAGCGV